MTRAEHQNALQEHIRQLQAVFTMAYKEDLGQDVPEEGSVRIEFNSSGPGQAYEQESTFYATQGKILDCVYQDTCALFDARNSWGHIQAIIDALSHLLPDPKGVEQRGDASIDLIKGEISEITIRPRAGNAETIKPDLDAFLDLKKQDTQADAKTVELRADILATAEKAARQAHDAYRELHGEPLPIGTWLHLQYECTDEEGVEDVIDTISVRNDTGELDPETVEKISDAGDHLENIAESLREDLTSLAEVGEYSILPGSKGTIDLSLNTGTITHFEHVHVVAHSETVVDLQELLGPQPGGPAPA